MRSYGSEYLMSSFDWPGRVPKEDPVSARIEAALDAGLDITEVVGALDALEGFDLESEEDGEGISETVNLTQQCDMGHFHRDEEIQVS